MGDDGDYRYETLIVKQTTYIVTELKLRINRLKDEWEAGILPLEDMLLSKENLDKFDFVYHHGKRNLLSELSTGLDYSNLEGELKEAASELVDKVYNLVPMDVVILKTKNDLLSCLIAPVQGGNEGGSESTKDYSDFVELYLVEEKCLVKVRRNDNADLIHIRDRAGASQEFKEYMEHVVMFYSGAQTINHLLMEKECKLRQDRYCEQMNKCLEKIRSERAAQMWPSSSSASSSPSSSPQLLKRETPAAAEEEPEDQTGNTEQKILEELKAMESRLSAKIANSKSTSTREDKFVKEKNVIILNLPEVKTRKGDYDNHEKSLQNLLTIMKLPDNFDYDTAFRIGKWSASKTRPFLVKFVRLRDKETFMRAKVNLKGTSIHLRNNESDETTDSSASSEVAEHEVQDLDFDFEDLVIIDNDIEAEENKNVK